MDEFDKALSQASEQGSDRWHDIRIGRFTSSEFHKLIQPGKRPMTPEELAARPKSGVGSKAQFTDDNGRLSEGGETYIYQKVSEVLTGQPKPEIYSFATSWGQDWEPVAAEHFEKVYGVKTEPISFVPWGEHFGGSPDRILGDELIEIKCPHESVNQVKYLMYSDQDDLKANHSDYYWQIMCNLLWTQKKVAHFVTFDPRFKDDKHKMSHIKVYPDQKAFDKIIERGKVAVTMKLQIIQTLSMS
jgi:YqaJ-like recombinase protein